MFPDPRLTIMSLAADLARGACQLVPPPTPAQGQTPLQAAETLLYQVFQDFYATILQDLAPGSPWPFPTGPGPSPSQPPAPAPAPAPAPSAGPLPQLGPVLGQAGAVARTFLGQVL